MIRRNISITGDPSFFSACENVCGLFGCEGADLLFYDIETTGLSPRDSYVYLIGCIYLDNGTPVFSQFFSECPDDEENLISEFETLLAEHPFPVDYNGSSFDMPFLTARAAQYDRELSFAGTQIDIYRLLRPYKDFFRIRSLRLKAVEQFVGIRRKDIYDGKELIDMYIRYVASAKVEQLRSRSAGRRIAKTGASVTGQSGCGNAGSSGSFIGVPAGTADDESGLRLLKDSDSKLLLKSLLLHNEEDVLNMPRICALLSVVTFLSGAFSVEKILISEHTLITLKPADRSVSDTLAGMLFSGRSRSNPVPAGNNSCEPAILTGANDMKEYRITLPSGAPYPVSLTINNDRNVELTLRPFDGELKLFFPDHKNYYYLINEDYAVHKSIGSFMDKSVCVKCTAANCYTRKSGLFLPAPEKNGGDLSDSVYLYRSSSGNRLCYVLADDLVENPEAAYIYAKQLLAGLKT